jgi:hypothetical protein
MARTTALTVLTPAMAGLVKTCTITPSASPIVTLRHVKLADTGEAVARVLAEKAAGRAENGSN